MVWLCWAERREKEGEREKRGEKRGETMKRDMKLKSKGTACPIESRGRSRRVRRRSVVCDRLCRSDEC